MRRTPLTAIILLAVLGAGAAAWWIGSADDRRVSACREAGVESADRLARCAESAEASKAVLRELEDAQIAEFRARVLKAVRARLVELRAGARSEVDTSRYEHLSVESLIEGYGLARVWIGRSEVPAGVEGRRFAVDGRLQAASAEPGDFDRRTEPEFYLWPATIEHASRAAGVDEIPSFSIVEADIGDLTRNERAFARDVCEFFYARLAYDAMGCPVIAYGRVVFESLGGLLAEDAASLLEPIFRIEAVEFQDPPQP